MPTFIPKLIYLAVCVLIFMGLISSPIALALGFLFTLVFRNPFTAGNHRNISFLLKIAIVGLGFGMLMSETLKTGKEGLVLTIATIFLTVTVGLALSRFLRIETKLGHLITSGTAICGGSAIVAIAETIRANRKTISVALGIIFLLNAIALFIFPVVGHYLQLTQTQFGLWCAVAIHDTSSVVGAALEYGDEALKVATTVKLSRTLWIIPLVIFSMFYFKSKSEKIKIPYFIILFILAVLVNSYQIIPENITHYIVLLSKRLLVLSIFLIGITISIKDLKSIGPKPIWLAVILWIFISLTSLAYIMN